MSIKVKKVYVRPRLEPGTICMIDLNAIHSATLPSLNLCGLLDKGHSNAYICNFEEKRKNYNLKMEKTPISVKFRKILPTAPNFGHKK